MSQYHFCHALLVKAVTSSQTPLYLQLRQSSISLDKEEVGDSECDGYFSLATSHSHPLPLSNLGHLNSNKQEYESSKIAGEKEKRLT